MIDENKLFLGIRINEIVEHINANSKFSMFIDQDKHLYRYVFPNGDILMGKWIPDEITTEFAIELSNHITTVITLLIGNKEKSLIDVDYFIWDDVYMKSGLLYNCNVDNACAN